MNGLWYDYLTYIGYGKTLQLISGLSTDYYDHIGYGTEPQDATTQAFGIHLEAARADATATFDDANRHNILTATFTGFATATPIYEVGVFDQDETNADAIMPYHYLGSSPIDTVAVGNTLQVVMEMGIDDDDSEQIPYAGLVEAAKLMVNYDSPAAFTYVAYGTGTTAFAKADTALVTQTERKAASKIEIVSKDVYFDTLRYTTAFTATTAEKIISEVGVFNQSSGGDMLMRKVISPAVTVPSGKVPVVVIDLQISAGGTA